MHGLVNRMSKDFGLCKAKNEYGKWVLGYIIWLNDKPFIVSEIKDRTKEFMLNTIQPDTICRYAGIIDYNGEKVFEGDIFAVPDENEINREFRYQIMYDEEDLVWMASDIFGHESINLGEFRPSELDIRGNIFDNPELFEKGGEEDE